MYGMLCVYIMCVYMSTQPMIDVNLGPYVSVLLLSHFFSTSNFIPFFSHNKSHVLKCYFIKLTHECFASLYVGASKHAVSKEARRWKPWNWSYRQMAVSHHVSGEDQTWEHFSTPNE